MNLKPRKLQLRLTKEVLTYIMEHSANYCSISHYIRSAVNKYSYHSTVRQIQLIEAPRHFYNDNLSQFSAYLNNAVKRANEFILADYHTQPCFTETLLSQIINTRIFLDSVPRQLPSLPKKSSVTTIKHNRVL